MHTISDRPLVDPQLQFYHRKNSGLISPWNGILSTSFFNLSSKPSTAFANSLYAKVIASYGPTLPLFQESLRRILILSTEYYKP